MCVRCLAEPIALAHCLPFSLFADGAHWQVRLTDLADAVIYSLPKDAWCRMAISTLDLYEDDDDLFCMGRAWGGRCVTSRQTNFSFGSFDSTKQLSTHVQFRIFGYLGTDIQKTREMLQQRPALFNLASMAFRDTASMLSSTEEKKQRMEPSGARRNERDGRIDCDRYNATQAGISSRCVKPRP